MNFIQEIVKDIKEEQLKELVDKCYIFPTRRACAFFRNELQNKFSEHTYFAPKIMSIQDCATHLTNMYVADDLHLLLELFKVYIDITEEEFRGLPLTFDIFYPWGMILLKDFDEIDKYLVSAEHIYSTLFEIRELEVEYNLNEELVEIISRFRNVMNAEQKTELQELFLKVWGKSYEVYKAFKTIIKQKQIAYEGLIYTEWLDMLSNNEIGPYKEYNFCGFNALSKVEEAIIDKLLKAKVARIYWDADTFYLNDKKQEAGMFMRKYYQQYPPSEFSRWIITEQGIFNNTNYELIEIQGSVGQGRVCCQQLEKYKFDGKETALVLCDESHLFPTLYAMPEHIEQLNVTMGYPLKFTPLFALAKTLFDLQLDAKGSENRTWFRHTSIQNLLNNTYFRSLTGENGALLLKKIIDDRLAWIPFEVLNEYLKDEWLINLFQPLKKTTDLLERLELLLFKLFKQLDHVDADLEEQETNNEVSLEQEIVFHFIKHINTFRSRIDQYEFSFDGKHLKKIFLESIIGLKIPFSGEPLRGVQLMGFLESRVLDFENVIISGMNEGNIPASKKQNSFIPYAIRKAYGLPTFEEQDAIYAYHFFRLLQRARNVVLISDSLSATSDSGETSRFFQQIDIQLKLKNTLHEKNIFSTVVKANLPGALLSIDKTEEIQHKLSLYEAVEREEKPKFFSPTALCDYIRCPIQFYLNRIAELKPVSEFEEEIKHLDLGNVVHETLEIIYKPYQNKEVKVDAIKSILKSNFISDTIEEVLRKERFIGDNKFLEGKNYMTRSVIEKIVKKVLQNDLKDAPFKIILLEASKYNAVLELSDGRKVRLFGQIDRIDEKDGIIRVIDYKTGASDINNRISRNKRVELFDYITKYFEDPKFKAGFQAYFYAYLYHKRNPQKTIKAGIYGLKTLGAGIKFLNNNEILDQDFFENFEGELQKLVDEIMNKDIPFVQTEDKERYKYSDYVELLGNI